MSFIFPKTNKNLFKFPKKPKNLIKLVFFLNFSPSLFKMPLIFPVFLCIFLFFPPLSPQSPKAKCRALALEGGGDAGSWQAGAIAGLVANLPDEEVQYDVISGFLWVQSTEFMWEPTR